jgi:hypothetical protein
MFMLAVRRAWEQPQDGKGGSTATSHYISQQVADQALNGVSSSARLRSRSHPMVAAERDVMIQECSILLHLVVKKLADIRRSAYIS